MSDTAPYVAPRPASDLAGELRATVARFGHLVNEILQNTGASPHLEAALASATQTVRETHAHLDQMERLKTDLLAAE